MWLLAQLPYMGLGQELHGLQQECLEEQLLLFIPILLGKLCLAEALPKLIVEGPLQVC